MTSFRGEVALELLFPPLELCSVYVADSAEIILPSSMLCSRFTRRRSRRSLVEALDTGLPGSMQVQGRALHAKLEGGSGGAAAVARRAAGVANLEPSRRSEGRQNTNSKLQVAKRI
jgi:hypothetical protein